MCSKMLSFDITNIIFKPNDPLACEEKFYAIK